MAELTLYTTGTLLADVGARTLSGLLLPYNEEGRTSLGRLVVPPGVLHAAAAVLPYRDKHKGPIVGTFTHEDSAEGVRAVVTILPGPEGDAILAAEAHPCSVEVEPITVRGGRVVFGVLVGAAAVEEGAFPSARLAAEADPVVPDIGDAVQADPPADPKPPTVEIDGVELPDVATVTVGDAPVANGAAVAITTTTVADRAPENTTRKDQPVMTAAAVQTAALAAAAAPSRPTAEKIGKSALFAMLAEFNRVPGSNPRLEAALSDITTANILGVEQPQYVGELWSGTQYERIIVPGFAHADLTAMKVAGWRFKAGKKPVVAAYTGNKADIPSNPVETEPADADAYRIAGGWDIDRKFRDFSNEAFWAALYSAAGESYKLQSDLFALADILAAAKVVVPGVVPAGVDAGLAAVVDGILAILGSTRTLADGAYVAPDVWRETMLTRADDALPMLDAMLGFDSGTMRKFSLTPCADLDPGQVLVKVRAAVTVHELPGVPIRVEALDVAKGGIDVALFGYQAVDIHNADGLALVTVA